MKRTFRMVSSSITVWLLLFACVPKSPFYSSKVSSRFDFFQHKQVQQAQGAPDLSATALPLSGAPGDSAACIATFAEDSFSNASGKTLSLAGSARAKPLTILVPLLQQRVRDMNRQRASHKNTRSGRAEALPVQRGAWLGFLFSMAGVVLLLVTLSVANPLILLSLALVSFLAGIIVSRNALSRIKKEPDNFSGRGLALAGFIIGLLMLAVLVAFLLYILTFAGAIQ